MKLQRLDFLLVATVGLYLDLNWYLNVSSTIDVDSELQVASGVPPSPRTCSRNIKLIECELLNYRHTRASDTLPGLQTCWSQWSVSQARGTSGRSHQISPEECDLEPPKLCKYWPLAPPPNVFLTSSSPVWSCSMSGEESSRSSKIFVYSQTPIYSLFLFSLFSYKLLISVQIKGGTEQKFVGFEAY